MQLARQSRSHEARRHGAVRAAPGRTARGDPRRFGRRPALLIAVEAPGPSVSDDLKLFALTFLGGFLFVSVLIG